MRTIYSLLTLILSSALLIGCAKIETKETQPLPQAKAVVPAAPLTPKEKGSKDIEWRVAIPFRLFRDQKYLYHFVANSRESQSDNPIQHAEERLAQELRAKRTYATPYAKDTFWFPGDAEDTYISQKRKMTYEKGWVTPLTHAVEVRLNQKHFNESCKWRVDGQAKTVSGRCDTWQTIELPSIEGGSRASARVSVVINDNKPGLSKLIEVRDLLIVGLGDSFASGEGNPDKPATFTGGHRSKGFPLRGREAFWLDRVCHRSLYSHQARAAMQLANYNPHVSVTFISFSCSGAEVFEGLLKEYKGPERLEYPPGHWKRSQFDSVVETLCRDPIGPVNNKRCRERFKRSIDFLLLSIGGNDVGFAPVVTDVVATRDQLWMIRFLGLVTFGALISPTVTPEQAERLISNRLGERYRQLAERIDTTLQITDGKRVLITLYPNIVHDANGKDLCGTSNHQRALELVSTSAYINTDESRRVLNHLLNPLNEFIIDFNSKQPSQRQWTIIKEHMDKFKEHGWCASDKKDLQDTLSMPKFSSRGTWEPFPPTEFSPYANRTRWVRTPNDAFLTISLQKLPKYWITRWLLGSIRTSQLIGVNGAFHPTAMGHAVIADAVYNHLIALLKDKYDLQP